MARKRSATVADMHAAEQLPRDDDGGSSDDEQTAQPAGLGSSQRHTTATDAHMTLQHSAFLPSDAAALGTVAPVAALPVPAAAAFAAAASSSSPLPPSAAPLTPVSTSSRTHPLGASSPFTPRSSRAVRALFSPPRSHDAGVSSSRVVGEGTAAAATAVSHAGVGDELMSDAEPSSTMGQAHQQHHTQMQEQQLHRPQSQQQLHSLSPPRSPPRVIRSTSGQERGLASGGRGGGGGSGRGSLTAPSTPRYPVNAGGGSGVAPLVFSSVGQRSTPLRPPPLAAAPVQSQSQHRPPLPESQLQRQRITSRMQKSAPLGLQEALNAAAARSAQHTGPATSPSSPRSGHAFPSGSASGSASELHTPLRPSLAAGSGASSSSNVAAQLTARMALRHTGAQQPTSLGSSSTNSSAWTSPSLSSASSSASSIAGLHLGQANFSLDDAPAVSSTAPPLPLHPSSPALLGRAAAAASSSGTPVMVMPVLPDFSGVDHARHQSPAIRSRTRHQHQAHGHGAPPPTPTNTAYGRSLVAHGHSQSYHDAPSPLIALFAAGQGGGGGGSFSLGSSFLSGGGGSAFGGASSVPTSTPSTPSRTAFKRRCLAERSELDRDCKLFSFVSTSLLETNDANATGAAAPVPGITIGPEHSYSVVRAQAQAAAAALASGATPVHAPQHPSAARSPLWGPAPSSVGAGDSTPLRLGRSARSPGLQPARSGLLFAPLSLGSAATLTHAATGAASAPTSTNHHSTVLASSHHPASAFGLSFSSGFGSTSLGALSMPMPPPMSPPLRPRGGSNAAAAQEGPGGSGGGNSNGGIATSATSNMSSSSTASSSSSSSSSAASSRHVPFSSFTVLGRLGSGSFGDVLAVRVERDEWNQAHYPSAAAVAAAATSTGAATGIAALLSKQQLVSAPVLSLSAVAAPAMLELAVKKAKVALKGIPARNRVLRQLSLLHGLFTTPDPRFNAPLTSDLSKNAAVEPLLPSSRVTVAPAVWHPSLVQLHAVWQEAPGLLYEAMELCAAPREFRAYRGGHTGTTMVATLEEYFLVLRQQVDDATAGRSAPALLTDASDAGNVAALSLPGGADAASADDGAYKTPRCADDDNYDDDDDGNDGGGSLNQDHAMGTTNAEKSAARMSDHGGFDSGSDNESDAISSSLHQSSNARRQQQKRRVRVAKDSDNESDAISSSLHQSSNARRQQQKRRVRVAKELQLHFPDFLAPSSLSAPPPPPAWMTSGALHPCEAELLRAVEQIGGALLFMHHHGVLHFDVKPGNIFCVPVLSEPPAMSSDPSVATSLRTMPWCFGHTRYKLGDYGSLVSVNDYVRSAFASSSSSSSFSLPPSNFHPAGTWGASGDDGASVASVDTSGFGGGAFEPDEGDGDFLAPELLNRPSFLRPPRPNTLADSSMDEHASSSAASAAEEEAARLALATQLAPAIDVYSFGMTIFSLLTGRLFRRARGASPEQQLHQQLQQERDAEDAIVDGAVAAAQTDDLASMFAALNFPVTLETQSLVARMLEQDPRNRPTMRSVVEQAHATLARAHAADYEAAQAALQPVSSPVAGVPIATSEGGAQLSTQGALLVPGPSANVADMECAESAPSSSSSASARGGAAVEPLSSSSAASSSSSSLSFLEPPSSRTHEGMVRTSQMQRLSVSHSRSHDGPLSATLAAAANTAVAGALAPPDNHPSDSMRADRSSSSQSTPLSPVARPSASPRRLFPPSVAVSGGAPGLLPLSLSSSASASPPCSSPSATVAAAPTLAGTGGVHSSSSSLSLSSAASLSLGPGLVSGGLSSCLAGSVSSVGTGLSNAGSTDGSACSSTAASPPISATVSPVLSFAAPSAVLPLLGNFAPLGSTAQPQMLSGAKPLNGHATFPRTVSIGRGLAVPTPAVVSGDGGRDARDRRLLAQLQMAGPSPTASLVVSPNASPPNGTAGVPTSGAAHVPIVHSRANGQRSHSLSSPSRRVQAVASVDAQVQVQVPVHLPQAAFKQVLLTSALPVSPGAEPASDANPEQPASTTIVVGASGREDETML